MKTDVIVVSSKGNGMDAALAQADSVAEHLKLSHKDALHLRLLVEEMMNMMCSIIGQLEGKFWIETTEDACRLYLRSVTLLDTQQRNQLISASSSGKNAAHRGLMGKIRAFFEPLPIDSTPEYLIEAVSQNNTNGDLSWSMEAYRERLRRMKDTSDGAQEEWDELEKSVVSHIADDIEVSIRGYDVELMILKKLA